MNSVRNVLITFQSHVANKRRCKRALLGGGNRAQLCLSMTREEVGDDPQWDVDTVIMRRKCPGCADDR